MRCLFRKLKTHSHWLILFLITTLFFTFLVWLTDSKAFNRLALTLFIFSLLIVSLAFVLDNRLIKKQVEAFNMFLMKSDDQTLKEVLIYLDEEWHPSLSALLVQHQEREAIIKNSQLELQDYQDFIEGWTHEIKTPLSLATLILANRREEMSPYVYKRMSHVRWTVASDVDRILYYARLQTKHVDYKFESINLDSCVRECLEAFLSISEEKKISIQLKLVQVHVMSDIKVLNFMISQLLSNAFKYTDSEAGIVSICGWVEHTQDNRLAHQLDDEPDSEANGRIHLAIRDNGSGVPLEDLPFVFDKGFTGNHPNRQSATGLGLYLVKKYAEALSIEVKIEPVVANKCGFGIQLIFPVVSESNSVYNSINNDK